ncbi:MAG: SUMF1/EgtB/PvdO family nonheme iron enzyme [Candidatus Coatesbacteria bacterium]|nr:SUMF1/EgtB/PvdO family nonheme iron enzyme [Candidatus Coatesbacteria bacterium]
MHRLRCAILVVVICGILISDCQAGPVVSVTVLDDVFSIGDDVEFWATAANRTHEFDVDIYLSGTTDGATMYLGPSGWTTEAVPLFAGFLMPQLTEPTIYRLTTIKAGEPPSVLNKATTLKIWITPSNVGELVYSEDETSFSVAPEGFVAIPSGRFMMGTGFTPNPREREVPHKVCLSSFFMAETETTVSDFSQFLNAAGATLDEAWIFGPNGVKWGHYLTMPIKFVDGVFAAEPGCDDYPADVHFAGAEAYSLWKG